MKQELLKMWERGESQGPFLVKPPILCICGGNLTPSLYGSSPWLGLPILKMSRTSCLGDPAEPG